MHLPASELPRERMLRDGIDALSLQELLAILLGTGTTGKNVLELSAELLNHFGSIEGLLNASIHQLKTIKGIGEAKAISLKAAFAIALRASRILPDEKKRMTSDDCALLAQSEIGHLKQEALLVILRDARERYLHHDIIGLGTLTQVLAHPREIFHSAICHNAQNLIICHNHPSGDPSPSEQDYKLTRKLIECGKLLSIPLADHIIVTKNDYFSMLKFKTETQAQAFG